MRRATRSLLILALAQVPGLVQAQIYTCKDAAGRTITSDRLIPECASRPMRELGNNGIVRRDIPAPLTAEQRMQKRVEEDRQKAEADAALEQSRRDMAILERFRSEREIEAARKRAVSGVEEKIRLEQLSCVLADKQLAETLRDAERYKKNGVLPPLQASKVAKARDVLEAEQQRVVQHRQELLKMEAWYDDTLTRFRLLSQSGSAP